MYPHAGRLAWTRWKQCAASKRTALALRSTGGAIFPKGSMLGMVDLNQFQQLGQDCEILNRSFQLRSELNSACD